MINKKVVLGLVVTLSFTIIILTLNFAQLFLTLSIEKDINSYNIESVGKEVMYNDITNFIVLNETKRQNLLDETFLETAEEVYKLHEDYSMINDYEFDWIYKGFIKTFKKEYTTEIDNSYKNNEYIQTIPELISNGYRGDCDDYAMFFFIMAKKKGLEARYMAGTGSIGGHAWIQIKKDGKWIEYDSTSNTICDGCISKHFEVINYFE